MMKKYLIKLKKMSDNKIHIHKMPGDRINGYFYFTYNGIEFDKKLWDEDEKNIHPTKDEVVEVAEQLGKAVGANGYEFVGDIAEDLYWKK